MKIYKYILPLAAVSILAAGCDDQIMQWVEPDSSITAEDIPLTDSEKVRLYGSIKEYAAANHPNMIVGLGLGAEQYVDDPAYKALADENFQMFTTGNAMKHSSVVSATGALNFDLIDRFMAAVPEDVEVYGHNFIWHTQQKQQYLRNLIAPEVIINTPSTGVCENVVTNSGFESGTNGWTGLWGKYSYEVTSPGRDSENCLHFTISDECVNMWDAQLFWPLSAPLEDGVTYAYEFYIKSDAGLQAQFIGQNESYAGIYKDTFTAGSDWTYCTGEFTYDAESNPADIIRVGIQFGSTEAGAQLWVDDFQFGVKVEAEPDPMVNIVTNPSFEDGTTGWTGLWGKYSYEVAAPGYDGDNSIHFTISDECVNMWDAQLFWALSSPLVSGETYVYDFYAKSDSGLAVQFIGQNESYAGIYKDTFTPGTDWTYCTGEFTYEGDPADIIRVGIQFGTTEAGSQLWVDNFRFGVKNPEVAEASAKPAATEITYIHKTPEEKKAILLEAMETWIKGMAEHLPQVKYWDVINEPIVDGGHAFRGIDGYFGGSDDNGTPDSEPVEETTLELNWASDHFYWGYYCGMDYAVKAFEYARQYCPADAKLFVNDYNLETDTNKLAKLIELVNYIEANGQTVDGIGTQMHVSTSITREQVDAMFKTMAATGKLVRVTELDVTVGTATPSADQLLAQAETYKMIFESFFENVPEAQQSGITIWTLSDHPDEHVYWLSGDAPNLFDANYERKLAYKYVCDALAGYDLSEEFEGSQWKDLVEEEEEETEE